MMKRKVESGLNLQMGFKEIFAVSIRDLGSTQSLGKVQEDFWVGESKYLSETPSQGTYNVVSLEEPAATHSCSLFTQEHPGSPT